MRGRAAPTARARPAWPMAFTKNVPNKAGMPLIKKRRPQQQRNSDSRCQQGEMRLDGAAQDWGRPVGCDHGELMDNEKHFIMSCSSSKTNLQANKVFNEESIQWIDSWRVWDTVEIGRRDHIVGIGGRRRVRT